MADGLHRLLNMCHILKAMEHLAERERGETKGRWEVKETMRVKGKVRQKRLKKGKRKKSTPLSLKLPICFLHKLK